MSNRWVGFVLGVICWIFPARAQDFNQIYDSIIRLDEVIVFPFQLSGQLGVDAAKIKTTPQVSKYSLALPNRYVFDEFNALESGTALRTVLRY